MSIKAAFYTLLLTCTSLLHALPSFNERVVEWKIDPWIVHQINEQFKPWEKSGISERQLLCVNSMPGWNTAGRYKFIDGKMYKVHGSHCESDLEQLLQVLHQNYGLPDIDFLICAGADGYTECCFWPPIADRSPVLSKAQTDLMDGIISFIDCTVGAGEFGRKQWSTFATIDRFDCPWDEKIELAHWRGTISDGLDPGCVDWMSVETWGWTPRTKLCDYSLLNPDIVDAAHTGWTCMNRDVERLNIAHPPSPGASYEEQLQYRYIICADGNTTTFPGFQWRLYSNSVVIKHQSHKFSWFYRGLRPYVHYVPVNNDFSNLRDVVTWCRDHDAECRQIAHNAKAFMGKYHNPDMYFKYAYLVLLKYAELQNFKPKK